MSARNKKKTWQEKLEDDKGFPRVFKIDGTRRRRRGTGTFIIPAPVEVDRLMRRVPKGKLTTIDELRKVLAPSQGHHGLSHHDRHFRMDCRACRG